MQVVCQCKQVFANFTLYALHAKVHFLYDEPVVCALCKQILNSSRTYYRHILLHRGEIAADFAGHPVPDELNPIIAQPQAAAGEKESFTYAFLSKLISLKEVFKLPDTTMNNVVVSLITVMNEYELFNDKFNYMRTKEIVLSTYKQQKFLSKNHHFVDVTIIETTSGQVHFISVKETLKQLLTNIDIQLCVLDENVQPNLSLKTFQDGELCKDMHRTTLRLQLYIDDFNVTNPLRSNSKQTITAVYFIINNLPYHAQCKWNDISLIQLSKKEIIAKESPDIVYNSLINELNDMFLSGLQIEQPNGTTTTITVRVVGVCGDNLAIHEIAGLMKSFGSGYCCRWCNATSQSIQHFFSDDCFIERNNQNIEISLMRSLSGYGNHGGVKRLSVFGKLPYFNHQDFFPPDIMHDLMEGVLPKIIEEIMQKMNKNKFSEMINERMNDIPWSDGRVKQFKPQNITVKGTACQIYEFFIFFPFIVTELSSAANKKLKNVYHVLRKITRTVFSPDISRSDLDQLDLDVQVFLKVFKETFPNANITPKMHFLVHFVKNIKNFGPLTNFSSLRFERKHQQFKLIAQRINNFKNLTLSLARRHQRNQCLNIGNYKKSFVEHISINDRKNDPELIALINKNDFLVCNSVNINGLLIEKGLVYKFDLVYDIPQFKRIYSIVIDDDKTILVGQELKTKKFDTFLFAYEVEITGSLSIIQNLPSDHRSLVTICKKKKIFLIKV